MYIQIRKWTILALSLVALLLGGCSGEDSGGGGGGGTGDFDPATVVSPGSGLVPLVVNFSAPQHASVRQYSWDFGDGATATGRIQTHTYVNAGTFTVRLTATLQDNSQLTAERRIYAFISIDNTAAVPASPDALFSDEFEYEAGREDPAVRSVFLANGWTHVKTQQDPDARNPLGYIYTTDEVLNYVGQLPGRGSNRVLAMEGLPTSLGFYEGPGTFWGNMQTDFYLQYGSESFPLDTIPANVWIQFWMYTTGGSTGGFDRGMKFMYVCRGPYPCQDYSWMGTLGSTSQNPLWAEEDVPASDIFLQLRAPGADWDPGFFADDQTGQTSVAERILGGRWVLVKMHIDTSGSQGVYEAWLRPMGAGEAGEVKVAEAIGGVTPNFNWPVTDNTGHRVMRIPTTIGSQNVVDLYNEPGISGSFDVTIYLDDFTIATSEEDLPQYPY